MVAGPDGLASVDLSLDFLDQSVVIDDEDCDGRWLGERCIRQSGGKDAERAKVAWEAVRKQRIVLGWTCTGLQLALQDRTM